MANLFKKDATKAADRKFMPPKGDPERLVSWLNEKREAGSRKRPERQWKLNLAFMLGEQWLAWDGSKRTFVRAENRPDDPNAPIRVTANKIGSITEHYISRLLKANPEPEGRPVGDEQADVDAAKVATRILVSEMNRLEWDTMQVDLYFWVVPLGHSYIQITWDPDSGPEIGVDETGEPVFGGDIDVDIVPAFEAWFDPSSRRRDLVDCRWGGRSVAMTPEAAWERWGVELRADGESQRTLAEEVLAMSDRSIADTEADQVMVHQFWLRPGSRMAPNGMVVTWSGDTILEGPMDFPYDHGRLPFVQWDLLPGMGVREGRTWMNDLIPLQADYNDARSREAGVRRTLIPKFIAPVGSVDPNRIGSRVELLLYNPIGQPPRLEMPDGRWMAQYEGAMQRADDEMGERSGQNDVNNGDIKPSMPAAAILALQEGDDTKLAIPAKLNAASTQRLGVQILELVRQFWDEPRIVRTWSQDGFLEVKHFTGANVAEQLDIHVTAESALPRSKASRAQLAMELRAEGLLQDPRKYVRMLDVPGVDMIVEDMDLDAKQQKRELNKMLATGQAVPVNEWDNHLIHYTEINNFRKSEDYEKLTPEQKAPIDAHATYHLQLMMGQAMAGATPGAPLDQGGLPMGGMPMDETEMVDGPEEEGGEPGGEGATGSKEYMDPMTGRPPQRGPGGQGPSPLSGSRFARKQGIGGPGNPGPVPGVSRDQQAARMGN